MASRAFGCGHVIEQEIAVALGGRFFQDPLEIRQNSDETSLAALAGFSIEQQALNSFWKLIERRAQIEAVCNGSDLQHVDQALRS